MDSKKLGFGLMRLPVLDEADRSKVDVETLRQMVAQFMERGFIYFDTAHRYHDEASEPAIRKALVEVYPRDSYILANKITLNYINSADEQEGFLKNQLAICGVEYFDNYLLHNMGAVSYPVAQALGTFDFLQQVKARGLAKRTGFSFHGTADVLEDILIAHPEVDLVQLQINYLDWDDPSIQSRKCYEVARRHGKQIVVMEPVKGGTLVNLPERAARLLREDAPHASLASWALRYAAGLEGVVTVLSGMSTPGQVEGNTRTMRDFTPLTHREQELLGQVVEIIRSQNAIACTSCRYCTAECPKSIAIPDYFDLYNNMTRLENHSYLANQTVYYMNLAKTHGKASDCIRCGVCEDNCPQSLPIRDLLDKVAAAME